MIDGVDFSHLRCTRVEWLRGRVRLGGGKSDTQERSSIRETTPFLSESLGGLTSDSSLGFKMM